MKTNNIKTAAPTTSRLARLFLLSVTNWNRWELICGDVKAAFLSGSGFDRVIIAKLPKDCNPLIGGDQIGPEGHIYMKLKKSAYGLADAPRMWYREASSRLTSRGWKNHPLDQCCFMTLTLQRLRQSQSIVFRLGRRFFGVVDVFLAIVCFLAFCLRDQKI